MVQRRNMHQTASDSAPFSVYFLIANGSRFLISLRNCASEFVLPLITRHLPALSLEGFTLSLEGR